VAKQKCGTCRFFEDGRFAGSGWCHHPLRHSTTGALIVVRRDELACRNGWDQNLWEPAGGAEPPGGPGGPPRHDPGPLPAAGPELVLPLLRQSSPAEHEGEDVLLSEARIVSERDEPWAPPRPVVSAGFDPRTAIFRAREAHRERQRAKAAAARQASGADAVMTAGASGHPTEMGGAPRESEELKLETMGSTAEDEEASLALPVERGHYDAPDHDPGALAAVGQPARAETAITCAGGHTAVAARAEAERSAERGLPSRAQRADRERESGRVSAPSEDPAAIAQAEAEPTDLPAWFRTDLPRICRSCRDFRPAADGQRGWCANAWAFTHSRLVHADEPAPCQSAIGDWWISVDDVWLVAADVSSHGRATPLLDRAAGGEAITRRGS
jgi:hypothetical protein